MESSQISLELLNDQNFDAVKKIRRDDINEDWVDSMDAIMETTRYGMEHHCQGHTYAVKHGETYIGVILLGEAFPWATDPDEMKQVPFYRLMNFVIDSRYRNRGIGGYVLELVIAAIYQEFGVRPIALGVHKDNHGAARFYINHGFRKTDVMEGNDYYFLRYPVKLDGLTLTDIQPSQFYLSQAKIANIHAWFDPTDLSTFDPIPVKYLNGCVIFTDGHTRAWVAHSAGLKTVPLAWDPDALDWDLYQLCVDACRERGVYSVSDLHNKILSEPDYEEKWIHWCDQMQKTAKGR